MGYRYFKNNLSMTNYDNIGCGASSLRIQNQIGFLSKSEVFQRRPCYLQFVEIFIEGRVSVIAKLSNPCLICKKTLTSAAGLKNHFKHHDEKAPRNRICGECGMGVLFPSALNLHVDGVHGVLVC